MNFGKQCTAHDQRVVAVHEIAMDGRGKPQHLERTTVEVIQGYRCWIHMNPGRIRNIEDEKSDIYIIDSGERRR